MILKLDLLKFIIRLCDKKFGDQIRSNAILSISLLTYNEKIFDEIIKSDVVMDMIMDICKDQNEETQVRDNATLALVNFALSKKSIKLLI